MKIFLLILIFLNLTNSKDFFIYSDAENTYYSTNRINWYSFRYKILKYVTNKNEIKIELNFEIKNEDVTVYDFNGIEYSNFIEVENQDIVIKLNNNNLYFIIIKKDKILLNLVIMKY